MTGRALLIARRGVSGAIADRRFIRDVQTRRLAQGLARRSSPRLDWWTMSRTRWALVALSFAVMITVTGWIVWNAFHKHGPPPAVPLWAHAAALAFVAVEIGSRAVKIQWGARAVSVRVSFWTAVRTCLGGDLASCLTPSRTGAEPARFLVLAETRMPPANILIVLFIELIMELTSLIAVGLGLWRSFTDRRALLGITRDDYRHVLRFFSGGHHRGPDCHPTAGSRPTAGVVALTWAQRRSLARHSASAPPPP